MAFYSIYGGVKILVSEFNDQLMFNQIKILFSCIWCGIAVLLILCRKTHWKFYSIYPYLLLQNVFPWYTISQVIYDLIAKIKITLTFPCSWNAKFMQADFSLDQIIEWKEVIIAYRVVWKTKRLQCQAGLKVGKTRTSSRLFDTNRY